MTGTETEAVTARPAPGYGEGRRALLAGAADAAASRGRRTLAFESVA